MYNFSNRSRGIAVAGFLPPRKSLSRSGRHRKTDTSTTRHLATRHLATTRHLAPRRRQPPYPHTTTDRPDDRPSPNNSNRDRVSPACNILRQSTLRGCRLAAFI